MVGPVGDLCTGRRTDVRCTAGLFLRQERQIAHLMRMVNQSSVPAERASWARGVALTTDVLLACEHYDEESGDCRLCRRFSALRRSEAGLVARTEARIDLTGTIGGH
jgi:hypothetical protein